MHVPKDSMWQGILKSFWFLGWTKQGLENTHVLEVDKTHGCELDILHIFA